MTDATGTLLPLGGNDRTGASNITQPPANPPFDEADHVSIPSTPSVDDLEWAGTVRQMFQKARSHRRSRVAQWMRNYQTLTTRTWKPGRAAWLPDPGVPEIYPIISNCVGWETDQRITPKVTPFATRNSPYATLLGEIGADLESVLLSVFVNEAYEAEIETMIWDTYQYGIGFVKTTWDALAAGGLGDPVVRRIDPFSIYPDPKATSMKDLSYIVEASTISLAEVERRFGSEARRKLAESPVVEGVDVAPNIISGAYGDAPLANPGTMSINNPHPSYGLPGQSRVHATDDPGVTILECWIREIKEVAKDGGSEDDPTDRYVSWRCIIVSGSTVLFNEPAENMWLHCDHPYSRHVLIETGEFYGLSMVELLTPCQLSIDRLLAALEHNIWLTGNPPFMEPTRSGITRTTITNKPGQRIQYNEGKSEPKWLIPPQMHPQMSMDLVRFYIDEMERISGLSAMTRGMAPPGRNSTEVLDSVQEASFVRIRLALRNLERTLRRALSLAASLVVEFYDVPRLMAILGPDGEARSMALRAKHFWLPTDDNRSIPMRFALDVGAGSSLPTSRIAQAQEADMLFAMGAIDRQGVLEAHRWPGRGEIMKRIQQQEAAGTFQPPGARQRAQRTT